MKTSIITILMLMSFNVLAAPLAVNTTIFSGWNKQVSYVGSENELTIAGHNVSPDADSINITQFDNRNGRYSELVVTVQEISGDFLWGGKAIGLSLSNTRLPDYQVANSETFVAPLGRAIKDNFIIGKLNKGEQLLIELSNHHSMVFVGAKVYLKQGSILKLKFEVQ